MRFCIGGIGRIFGTGWPPSPRLRQRSSRLGRSISRASRRSAQQKQSLLNGARTTPSVLLLRDLAESVSRGLSISGAVGRVQLLLKRVHPLDCLQRGLSTSVGPTPEETAALAAMVAAAKAADGDGLMTSYQVAAPKMLAEIKAAIDHESGQTPGIAMTAAQVLAKYQGPESDRDGE